MPGILTFESNMPIILIVIIIVLVSVYFFLDSKKSKLQIESLEKKTEVIVKEIDNIHLQLHKFFSKMPTSIIPDTPIKSEKQETNDPEPVKVESKSESNVELSVSDFNKLKKDNDNTNTLKEIESMISDNNNSIIDEGDDTNSDDLSKIPSKLNNNSIIDELNLDDEDDEDNEEDEEDDEDDEVEDVNLSDYDSDKLSEYLEMSVKDLKSKCIEMNLKHSGNKTTLARRIVENLE